MKSNHLSGSEHHSNWQWWLVAILAITAFGFGAYGSWQYESAIESGKHPDLFSIVYHTLQLFILHAPHLEHPVPWQLHVGRLLAAGVSSYAAVTALSKVFADQVRLLRLWLPWRRNHVVICGLGDLGLRLALLGRRSGHFVVAIEKDPTPVALQQARAKGVLVIEGDAREYDQLRRARVKRADYLVAACQGDLTNITIASSAREFGRKRTLNRPLVCHLLIRDGKLRQLVREEALFPDTGSGYRVNSSDRDLDATVARQALRHHPLDFRPIHTDDDTVVHLVVIGFGHIGQRLARQAARVGHYANEVGKGRKRLSLTVVDNNDPEGWDEFLQECNNLENVCDASHIKLDFGDAALVTTLIARLTPADPGNLMITYALCVEDDKKANSDEVNLNLGFEMAKATSQPSAQVLIQQRSSTDYSVVFSPIGQGSDLRDRVHAFGMEDDMFSWNGLFLEDQVAQALHENYMAQSGDSTHPGWNSLSKEYKESNRQAADHIPIKLRAIGYRIGHLEKRTKRIEQFDHPQMDLLSRMEHARWCAERYLAGWKYGTPTDRTNKVNECLVSWEQLGEKDKKKDWDQISAIPKILKSVGLGIYPMEN